MGHQEGTGEARRCANQDRDLIQFGVLEFDFDSNSESRTTSASNSCTGRIRNHIWTFYKCTERGRDNHSNGTNIRSN
jgi:hypothetical protein